MRSNSGVQLQQWLTVAVDVANVASANFFATSSLGSKRKNVVKLLRL
jgi:hypothetical protein